VTKERILCAARERFGAHGSASVSVRDVAAHAGVSLATVHHYFGTKEGLYLASVEAMYTELETQLSDLDLSELITGDAQETLARLTAGSYAFAREHRGALRLLMRTVIDQGELSEPLRERYQLPTLTMAAGLLAGLMGISESRARLALQSLIHVVLRYALSSDRELEMLTGARGSRATSLIEAHLIELSQSVLNPEIHP